MSSSKYYYELPSKVYRYWLNAKRLMIQMKRKDMEVFRNSATGRQVERHVDIFEVGGGWYEITGKEGAFSMMPEAIREIVEPKAGQRVWVAALNASFLSGVNANPVRFITVTKPKPAPVSVKTLASAASLSALAERFKRPAFA